MSNKSINISLNEDVAQWLLDLYNQNTPSSSHKELASDLPWNEILTAVTKLSAKDDALAKRQKIVEELITTEGNYNKSLSQIVKHFVVPLRENMLLDDEQRESVFSDIEIIYDLNAVFFAKLEKAWKLWPRLQTIGEVFLESAPLFKLYYRYIRLFQASLAHLQDYYKTIPNFKEFCEKKAHHLKILDLSALLIMPVQRLPRYEMLLAELLKITSESHSDYQNIAEAVKYIKSVNLYINKRQTEDQERDHMISLLKKTAHQEASVSKKISRTFKTGSKKEKNKLKLSENIVGFLQVNMKAGRDLAAMDSNGLSDPYCILSFGSTHIRKRRTKTVPKSLAPTWNEEFLFHIFKDDEPAKTELLITIMDKDQVSYDDEMGFLKFKLSNIQESPRHTGWFTVTAPTGGSKQNYGEIHLSYVYHTRAEGEANGLSLEEAETPREKETPRDSPTTPDRSNHNNNNNNSSSQGGSSPSPKTKTKKQKSISTKSDKSDKSDDELPELPGEDD